jgi:ACS family sodium-dependent inorganic phosphate cotransporter
MMMMMMMSSMTSTRPGVVHRRRVVTMERRRECPRSGCGGGDNERGVMMMMMMSNSGCVPMKNNTAACHSRVRTTTTTTHGGDTRGRRGRGAVTTAAAAAVGVVRGDAGGDDAKRSGYRFVVVALVALALMLCNADRVIMSVASVPLAAANGWGERAIGLVQSSFLWGYALTPLVGGVLADRYGGKVVLGFGIAVWSLATLATPFAATSGTLGLLLVTRAVMGLGEGVALPCMNNVISRWVPKSERSRAVAASMGGFQSGSMIGLLAAPALLAAGGIPGPFVLFGALGLVWAVVWNFASSTYPAECSMVNEKELAYIVENPGGALTRGEEKNDAQTTRAPPPFKLLLSKAPTWACIIANFVNNWGFFILLAWMPLYFKQVVGLNLREAAWFSALPWATMAASGIVAGTLADNLINSRGWSVTATRKLIQGVGFIGPALCLVALALLGPSAGAQTAVTLLTVAVGCTAFTQAGFLVNFQEIGPRYAGVLHGMANTAGSIAGMVGTYVVGYVLEATGGNWSAVLLVTSFVYLIGAATWLAWSTGERVFD